ncbi:MAG TPA: efflux RND transporter periplasmic adaptor subunit [Usitatibacter sp.]|nr:efflux RND transporter periplasmic adaptor subunit [Usitatibacter sp.]
MPVTIVKVAQRKVPVSLEAVGQAEGSREVEIRARVNGILEKRLFQEGAPVAAGQTLFQIDPAQYELAVQQARAALQQERVKRELAESEAKRLAPLADEKAISQRELDQANAASRTATASIAAAEANLKQAELNLSYTRITAPIGGVTGRALRSEGSLVNANTESSLLTTMTQVNPVWVRFSLAENDYERLRGNEKQARVQLVADDGTVAADNGKLNFTGSTVDTKVGAIQLRAEFANPGNRWMPGAFTKVRILAGDQPGMLVPQQAIMQGDQSRQVLTVGPDNKVTVKTVQTGGWLGSDTIITSGLAEGDMVIVDNLVKLRPGAVVQPKGPQQADAAK